MRNSSFLGCAAFLKKSLAKNFRQRTGINLCGLHRVTAGRRLRGSSPLRRLCLWQTYANFKIVIFYLAETDQNEVTISSEHDGFGWFQYKDARHILTPYKDSQRLLRSAYDYIRPKKKTVPLRTKQVSSKLQDEKKQSPLTPSDQA